MKDTLADIKRLVDAGSLAEYRNATIEECAQMADALSEYFVNHPKEMAEKIATAIRALKS